jgi:hypothetical protein
MVTCVATQSRFWFEGGYQVGLDGFAMPLTLHNQDHARVTSIFINKLHIPWTLILTEWQVMTCPDSWS